MKPGSQIKVILMSFFSIVVMVAIIATVSVITSSQLSSESAAGEGHSTEAASAEHGSEAKPAEDKMAAAKPAEDKMAAAKPAEDKMAATKPAEDKKAEAKPAETKTAAASGGQAADAGNAEAGAKVFLTKTCTTCHTVTKLPEAKGAIGPKLDGLGKTAATRKPGMSADAYIKESIENPGAFLVPTFQNMMTPTIRSTMNDQEFKDLVAFLHTL